MACFQKFEPAKFDEGDVPPGKFDFENSAVGLVRNKTACSFSGTPSSLLASTRSTTKWAWAASS